MLRTNRFICKKVWEKRRFFVILCKYSWFYQCINPLKLRLLNFITIFCFLWFKRLLTFFEFFELFWRLLFWRLNSRFIWVSCLRSLVKKFIGNIITNNCTLEKITSQQKKLKTFHIISYRFYANKRTNLLIFHLKPFYFKFIFLILAYGVISSIKKWNDLQAYIVVYILHLKKETEIQVWMVGGK